MTENPPPDPCTIVLPIPEPAERNEDVLQRWLARANGLGHCGTPVKSTSCGDPLTWCGDVTVDEIPYRLQRGPRLREPCPDAPLGYVLRDSVWAEPLLHKDVLPPPGPRFEHIIVDTVQINRSFREEVEVALKGRADGRRAEVWFWLTIDNGQHNPCEIYDRIVITVRPGDDLALGGINVLALDGKVLPLRLLPENRAKLGLAERVRFTLDVPPRTIEEVRDAFATMFRHLPEKSLPAVVRL